MKAVLGSIIDRLQKAFPVNRVVAIVAVVIVTPATAAASGWLAKNFPGVQLPTAAIATAVLGGAAGAVTIAYKWLDGWQQHEGFIAGNNFGFDPTEHLMIELEAKERLALIEAGAPSAVHIALDQHFPPKPSEADVAKQQEAPAPEVPASKPAG